MTFAPSVGMPWTGEGTALPSSVRTARWVGVLFVATIVLQRFAVPGVQVALLLPVALLWMVFAVLHGVVTVDGTRLLFFVTAAAATGVSIVLQAAWVPDRFLSVGSWALVLVTSALLVFRLNDRSLEAFLATLRILVRCGLALAGLCLVMTATQVVGLSYRDVFAAVVPSSLQLTGFALTYPYSYGSELYRANAWLGLEPSIISFQLGLALVAAVLLRRSVIQLAVLLLAMVSTASGSGFLVAIAAVLVLLGARRRKVLVRYVLPGLVAAVAAAATPIGLSLLSRVGEIGTTGSSASLRFIQPYLVLWPTWIDGVGTTLWGDGPGSSQEFVTNTGIAGLLVPTPAKIFFDYGLLGGAVLAIFLIRCYRRSLSRAFAVSLFASLWSIQPGLTTTVLVLAVVALVSLWSPRDGVGLEDVESPVEAPEVPGPSGVPVSPDTADAGRDPDPHARLGWGHASPRPPAARAADPAAPGPRPHPPPRVRR